MNVKPIFKDKSIQSKFDKNGYAIVELINSEEIESLNAIFNRSHIQLPKDGFFTSAYSNDAEYKKKSSKEIVEVVKSRLAALLQNYEICGADFIFKMPSKNSQLDLHQDWSFVNELEHVSLNCWIPLCDINDKNGAIHVLPGSHFNQFKAYRSPSIKFFFKDNEDLVHKKLIPLYVKAGQAIFINHSLVHYSPPNQTNEVRKAVVVGVKSEGAQMYFLYYDRQKKMLEYYQQEDNYAEKFENFAVDVYHRPKFGEFEKKHSFKDKPLSRKKLDLVTNEMLKRAGESIHQQESVLQLGLNAFKKIIRVK